MKRAKSKLLVVAAVALCCALAMGGTLAYYTAETTAHNVITTGDVDIEIREDFSPEEAKGLTPGTSVDKIVTIANTSSAPSGSAWVRVKVTTDVSRLGDEMPDTIPVDGVEQDVALIEFDDTKWIAKDGYFYYRTELPVGESTGPLFEAVRLNPLLGNDYQESEIHVKVQAQAVQSQNNPAPDGDVTRITNWPK